MGEVCLGREKIINGFLPTEAETMNDVNESLRYMNGEANFLGFKIQDVWGGEAESKHYRKGAAINICLEWFLIIITGGFPVYLAIIGTINTLWLLLSIPLVSFCAFSKLFRLLILELTICLPYFGDNVQEWHAIEHKTAYIIAKSGRKDLTLENLRKAPSTNPRCGFDNRVKDPSNDKLEEALKVGKKYLNVPE